MKTKHYSFYLVSRKYPVYLGRSYGKDKKDAFETMMLINGYSTKTLKLNKNVKGYLS